jgi:hypothetical protein
MHWTAPTEPTPTSCSGASEARGWNVARSAYDLTRGAFRPPGGLTDGMG